jgi:hypothetical protein
MTGVAKGKASFVRLARRELPAAVADSWLALLRPSFQLRAAGEDEPVGAENLCYQVRLAGDAVGAETGAWRPGRGLPVGVRAMIFGLWA